MPRDRWRKRQSGDALARANAALFSVPLANTQTANGVFYKIRDIHEAVPLYFAPTPLANTLQSGTVDVDTYVPGTGVTAGARKSQRFDSIDVNVLARDLLVSVEAFLDPAVSIPAFAASSDAVTKMLGHKEKLADAIYNDVTHIVTPPVGVVPADTLAKRRTVAANLLRRQLLVNLVEGFDVEAIIQSSVDVKLTGVGPATPAGFATSPRLVGQPVLARTPAATIFPPSGQSTRLRTVSLCRTTRA